VREAVKRSVTSKNRSILGWKTSSDVPAPSIVKGERLMCLGIPGQIISIVDDANSIAKVDVSGVKRNVNVALIRPEGIGPGDWVLIHVGFAMSKIDEIEAQETLKALEFLGDPFNDELEMFHTTQV